VVLTLVLAHLIETFSERDQTINIVVSDLRVVVDQLTDLRFEAAAEETNGVAVIEMGRATTVLLEQGNVLANGTLLAQVAQLVKRFFGIVCVDKSLAELSLEDLVGSEVLAIDHCVVDWTKLVKPAGGAIDQEEANTVDALVASCRNTRSVAKAFETNEPVLGSSVAMTAIESLGSETLEEGLRN
jgi:hypothetical protein